MTLPQDPREAAEQLAELAGGIEAAWDSLAALEEAGRLSPKQLRWLTRQEPDDAALLNPVRARLWLATLNRAVVDPAGVGANPDALGSAPHECRCLGRSLIESEDGTWRPCDRCNPAGYALWRDHWRIPGHSCARCARPARGGAPPTPEQQREDVAAQTRASLA